MTSSSSKLEQLANLAGEISSDKRRELLEGISGMFLDEADQYSEDQRDLFGDIIGVVADDVEEKVRAHLSERLSDVENAPRSLVMKLANDVIEVAAPQLLRSKVLNDQDLVKIVAERGTEHQLAISKRETVSEVVADALVDHGNDEVLVSLVQNSGASLSQNAMETLVAKSEHVEELQAPLIDRKDVTADLKSEMYWWVSSALRDQLINEIGVDEATADALVNEATQRIVAEAEEQAKMNEAAKAVDRLEKLGQLDQEAMVQLLRQGHREQFLHAFSRLTKIDLATASKVLSDNSHEAVAIACRATGFDLSTFSAIVLLYASQHTTGKQSEEVADLLDIYIKLPVEAAQRAMRFWRVRMKTQAAKTNQAAAG